MSSPTLGTTTGGAAVHLDVERLVVSRMLATANSGGGKSWLLRRLLEQTHGKVQHLIIDVEGEFHTLRERFDYVLAARTGGDTLADVRTAPLLARRLLELGVSAILDIYELKAHDRIRFVRLFLEALVEAPRELWHPALVVVDEAHLFCPQHGDAESATAVIDLMTRGRKRGFCGVLATQRLSKLHKDAAAEANVLLIGRAALDLDLKRSADILGLAGRDEQARLRQLRPGQFFAFGPGLSDTVVELRVGDVATTHPKAGQRAAPVPAPRERVRAVLSKLADLPKEAEVEARTAAELRAQVASLQRELRAAKNGGPSPEEREAGAALKRRVSELERALADRGRVASRVAAAVQAAAGRLQVAVAELDAPGGAQERAAEPVPRRAAPAPAAPRAATTRLQPPAETGLSGPEQRIVDAIAWLETLGVEQPEQAAVAFLAGYTIGGGAFNNPRGALRSRGLVDYAPGERIFLTEAGRAVARTPDLPLSSDELQRRVLERLPGPEQKILRVLIESYPEPVGNDELAQRAGYEPGGGAYNNPRGRLRTLGLIDYPTRGMVVARPLLFLEDSR